MIAYDMEFPGSSHTDGIDFDALTAPEQDSVKSQARLSYVSNLYVENNNQECCGDLKTQLANDYTLGTSNFPATLQEAQKLMEKYVGTKSSAPRARVQPPPVDNKIISNDVLIFFNKYDSPTTKRGKCKRCGSDEHQEGPKCPEYKKDRYLADKYSKLESEATEKLKSGAPVVEGNASETVNIYDTLGIEDDNFAGEDNYGLAFLNLATDGTSEVPTNIYSINYDTVFKQYGAR